MNSSNNTMLSLGYLGLLPFLLGVGMMATNISVLGVAGSAVFASYSAVILSFLSGVLWGKGLEKMQDKTSRYALILSNVFALLVWGLMLQTGVSFEWVIVVLALGFISVWYVEKRVWHADDNVKQGHYLNMRNKLTCGVVVLHIGALIFS